MNDLNSVHRSDAETLVDMSRYPVTDLDSEQGRTLINNCRRALNMDSACVLEQFILPAAVASALSELKPRLGEAYYCEKTHNPYLTEDDPAYSASHPRNFQQISDLGSLADDQIDHDTVLRKLYDWPPLHNFFAAILEVDQLYPYADPLGSLNLNVFQPGHQLGWHYDNADWVITLMLQPAEAGGVYEYVPESRQPDNEKYDQISNILNGTHSGVRRLTLGAGALILFRGRYTIHRVTPVRGRTPRLLAVLSYDTRPGVMLTEHNRLLFYGRVA